MSSHVIETVVFKLKPGMRNDEFAKIAQSSNGYVTGCAGFVARRLSCTKDGTWIEHIEWKSLQNAQTAAQGLGAQEDLIPFLSAIDETSVSIHHSDVQIALK